MQLIKLTSNIDTFKPVIFKKNSLNIITGSKSISGNKNLDKTFNGVGKSLLLNIINFCLGSSKYLSFQENLKGWIFTLEFSIGLNKYTVERSTDKQNNIKLNGELINRLKYCKILEKELFNIPEGVRNLTYRSLIKRFMRVEKESCNDWGKFANEQPYSKLLNTGFLLGLDIDLIEGKKNLKSNLDELNNSKKRLEKDDLFKKFFLGTDDIKLKIAEFEDSISKLNKNLKDFKIAENYNDIEDDLFNFQRKKRELSNKYFLIKNQIKSIDDSLNIKLNLSLSSVLTVYNDLKISIPELIKKELKEVESFHKNLIETRNTRLINSKYKLSQDLKILEGEIYKIGLLINDTTKFLSEHGALDEYDTLINKLNNERNTLTKLKDFHNVIIEYKKCITKLKIEIEQQNELSIEYLTEIENLLKENNSKFRELSKEFYPDSVSGITVLENTGENTIQFDIEVKINYDTSDGIGEIKIICFDLTLLLLKRNHNVEFIFHDSRIFSDVDSRQIAVLFNLIYSLLEKNNFQYIVSINQDTLDTIKEIDIELYKKLQNSIILELKDESPESKLLGLNIDMDYEK